MKLTKGFTLIELIVTSSIAVIVITIAIDLFVSITRYQRKVLAEQEISNQMSYVIEYMSRAIRMAKKDTTGDCLGSGNEKNYLLTRNNKGIKFINHSDNDICQEFFWDNDNGKIKEIKGSGAELFLNSDRVEITSLKFNLSGDDTTGDNLQPRVTIFIEAQTTGTLEQIKRQIQTTVSQRNLDVQ
jgi:prepilin-type N-terminal cleavage/methylation domain-containing protein